MLSRAPTNVCLKANSKMVKLVYFMLCTFYQFFPTCSVVQVGKKSMSYALAWTTSPSVVLGGLSPPSQQQLIPFSALWSYPVCTMAPRVSVAYKAAPFWHLPLASLEAQLVKNLPAIQETQVRSLDREDPLEGEMATHSSIRAWRIPWTEEPGRLQSTGSQRIR